MNQTGQTSPETSQVFDEWFAVTVKILKTKTAKQNIKSTQALFNSIDYEVPGTSEFISKGTLVFNNYGRFVDMGVGRGLKKGNSGNVQTSRRRKEWYSKIFYAQVMRLREIMASKYSKEAATTIVAKIEAVNDLKYAAYK